jgi:hypothetical protein
MQVVLYLAGLVKQMADSVQIVNASDSRKHMTPLME